MSGLTVTTDQARQISAAHAALTESLRPGPADLRAKAIAITRMLSGFAGSGNGDPVLRADAYIEALDGLPAWAVERSVGRVIRGEAGMDTRFAPSPAQMAVEARRAMQPAKDDLAALDRLRIAVADREASPEEKARVGGGFDRLLEELGRRPKAQASMARAAFEAHCQELGVDPDSVPDAKPRKDTWSKLPAQPERTA
jgi:hypothetical protein